MFKVPEKRCQSAKGLVTDLMRCRDEYSVTGSIDGFPLESSGYVHGVTFIFKMVGRDLEAEIILEEYEQAAGGKFRLLFISGLSGIGKTRLIQELQKPIVKHKGAQEIGKIENLFTIVFHLNLGRDSNPDSKTAFLLSDFNYHAGKKALNSLATESANEYFHLSRELLPAAMEKKDYKCRRAKWKGLNGCYPRA